MVFLSLSYYISRRDKPLAIKIHFIRSCLTIYSQNLSLSLSLRFHSATVIARLEQERLFRTCMINGSRYICRASKGHKLSTCSYFIIISSLPLQSLIFPRKCPPSPVPVTFSLPHCFFQHKVRFSITFVLNASSSKGFFLVAQYQRAEKFIYIYFLKKNQGTGGLG